MYNYIPNNYFLNNVPTIRNNNSVELYSPKEGYEKGNMFANLYSEYKNYKPKQLTATNEKERLFLELSKLAFAAHDLRLYLDVNDGDESMIRLFNDYNNKMINLMNEYESKYGTITSFNTNGDNYTWDNNNWPWERRDI